VDLSGAQAHRLLEIISLASLLQLLFRNYPNRVVWSHAVDADDLTPVVILADDSKHRVGGLGFQFRREAVCYPVAPRLSGDTVHGIDASRPMGADQAAQRRRRTKACDIAGRTGRIVFQVGGE